MLIPKTIIRNFLVGHHIVKWLTKIKVEDTRWIIKILKNIQHDLFKLKIKQNRIEIKKNMDLKENIAYYSVQTENVCEKKSTQKMTDGE